MILIPMQRIKLHSVVPYYTYITFSHLMLNTRLPDVGYIPILPELSQFDSNIKIEVFKKNKILF